MWVEIIEGAILVGAYVYHRWIEDHPHAPAPPSVVLPRVAEGTPLPIIYGQVRIRTPVLVWSGNYLVPGQVYAPWNPGTFGDLTADHYSADMIFILGIPFYSPPTPAFSATETAVFVKMWAGDSEVISLATINFGSGTKTFSGGPGVASTHTDDFSVAGAFFPGDSSQQAAYSGVDGGPYVPPRSGGFFPDNVLYDIDVVGRSPFSIMRQARVTQAPGFRNQIAVVMHVGLGLDPSIPGFSFEVRCRSVGSGSDLGHSTALDADPAAVIYDLMTSPWGKLGISASKVDLASFQAASATLASEGHGYSRVVEQAEDAWNIINDVLRQIDAVLYPEPSNGLITIKLIRNDYNVGSLDDINPDNARPDGAGWYQVQGWAETPNQVRLTYTDRGAAYADAIVIGQNQANAVANAGRTRSVSIRFQGCCVPALAQQLASRELAAVGRPVVRATVIVSRAFYLARPGSVYTLSWPQLGVSRMVMRVASVDLGQLHKGEIRLQLIRDIFDQKLGAYPPPP